MLAHPTPAIAFPVRAQRLAVYAAQNPVWTAWQRAGAQLWAAASTLDSPGITLAVQISYAAAAVLDVLYAQGPADVGFWRVYGPQVVAAWQTWEACALQPAPAQPTQTLALSSAATGALAALRAWDPMRQTALGNIGGLLQTVCQGITLTAAPTLPQTPATGGRWVTVQDNTTLIQLASRYLGSPEAWPQIMAANNLRAPYISSRLWEQYGPPVIAYVLGTGADGAYLVAPPVAAGATTCALPNAPPNIALPGAPIVFETETATGRQQEVHTITAFDPNTFVATLDSPLQGAYGTGSLMSVNLPTAWLTTRVVAPGTAIQIPQTNTAIAAILPNPQDPFGTDLYVDEAGFLAWTTTGDLMTATNVQNLQGALRRRLNTALGTLVLHPRQYGSGLPSLIGNPQVANHVVAGYARMALLPDPRVVNVDVVTVTFSGTAYQITATVQCRALPQTIAVTTTLIAA